MASRIWQHLNGKNIVSEKIFLRKTMRDWTNKHTYECILRDRRDRWMRLSVEVWEMGTIIFTVFFHLKNWVVNGPTDLCH